MPTHYVIHSPRDRSGGFSANSGENSGFMFRGLLGSPGPGDALYGNGPSANPPGFPESSPPAGPAPDIPAPLRRLSGGGSVGVDGLSMRHNLVGSYLSPRNPLQDREQPSIFRIAAFPKRPYASGNQ